MQANAGLKGSKVVVASVVSLFHVPPLRNHPLLFLKKLLRRRTTCSQTQSDTQIAKDPPSTDSSYSWHSLFPRCFLLTHLASSRLLKGLCAVQLTILPPSTSPPSTAPTCLTTRCNSGCLCRLGQPRNCYSSKASPRQTSCQKGLDLLGIETIRSSFTLGADCMGFPHNIGTGSDVLQTLGRHRRVHFCHP